MSRKVFILLPDGVGLRNFAFTKFKEVGEEMGFDPVYWNNTPFDLSSLELTSVNIDRAKPAAKTDLYKRALIKIGLKQFIKRFKDDIYYCYLFKSRNNSLKAIAKNLIILFLNKAYNSSKGMITLRRKMANSERRTPYYQDSLETLMVHRPKVVFCTNQRSLQAIAPLVAAKDLGIPTATFIFSWDNLPKATMVVETDYYVVWSEHMKEELLAYYPYIKEEQIKIAGTPQFEPHFNSALILSKEEFFDHHGLDVNKEYLCFSGDDVTTSPYDPVYLKNAASVIRKMNKKGKSLGILFRRCPVDFSGRYDEVLSTFKDVIVSLPPAWDRIGEGWNTVMPSLKDQKLLVNTAAHTIGVLNLGSSMVFDFAFHNKPCIFVNYKTEEELKGEWTIDNIYKFIHFRSMPNKDCVYWLDDYNKLEEIILKIMKDETNVVANASDWADVINQKPHDQASKRIWSNIYDILGIK